MPVDLKDIVRAAAPSAALEVVRIGLNQTAVVPFTSTAERVKVHYCDDAKIRGYAACGGDGCLLCAAGRAAEDKVLLPVYVPAERRVGVLMVSTSIRPTALLPQLFDHVERAQQAGRAVALLIHKTPNYTFEVAGVPLAADQDDGAAAVKQFAEALAAGAIDLTAVVQRFSPQQLRGVPGVARMLALKGVS